MKTYKIGYPGFPWLLIFIYFSADFKSDFEIKKNFLRESFILHAAFLTNLLPLYFQMSVQL